MTIIREIDKAPTDLMDRSGERSTWLTQRQVASIPTHRGPLAPEKTVGWEAITDVHAATLWLEEVGSRSALTADAYQRELRRFILWLADQGKVISDVTREDFHRYANFLSNPGRRWITTKRRKVSDPQWRPFRSPLSDKGKRYSLQVVHSMMIWMHNAGWVAFNPMPAPDRLAPVTATSRAEEIETRQIPQPLFDELLSFCESELYTERASVRQRYMNVRTRLILVLAGYLGARSADIINAHFGDFHPRQRGITTSYLWHIPDGKGRKAGTLPVPEPVMDVIRQARLSLGLMAEKTPGEPPCPIVVAAGTIPHAKMPEIEKLKTLERSSLYTIVREAFSAFEGKLRAQNRMTEATIMNQASTHWLRHTAIKRIVKMTNDITMAQRLARHDDLNTTGVYAKVSADELGDWFADYFDKRDG